MLNHTLPVLQHSRVMGEVSRRQDLDLAVVLKISDRTALNDRIEQLYDPASPLYHQFRTPAQFADEFGPSRGDYETVINFLKDNGLQVTATYPNRLLVEARGKVAQVEEAFAVKINNYTQDNQTFFANDRDPALPTPVASVIASVGGMENYLELQKAHPAPPVCEKSFPYPAGLFTTADCDCVRFQFGLRQRHHGPWTNGSDRHRVWL